MRLRSIPALALSLLLAAGATAQEVKPPEASDSIRPTPAQGGQTEAQAEHTVAPGDTLWDLCARYLNNPWYWPRVWSYNPEIYNPHWIYPGQMVRFYPTGALPGQMDTLEVSGEFEIPDEVPDDVEEELVPENLVTSSDRLSYQVPRGQIRLRRNAFVAKEDLDAMGSIYASRSERQFLAELDPVYLHFKDRSAVQVGQKYAIMRSIEEIYHPITERFIGYYIRVLGICHVVNVGEEAVTAIITTSLEPIERGDKIGPLLPDFTKNIASKPNGVELRGYVIGSKISGLTLLGEHHIVFLDQGSKQGVEAGNIFDVVRREDSLFLPGSGKEENRWDPKVPPEIYARIMVIDTRENASTGMVIASIREVRVGDRVYMAVK
ncbi:MAG: LysM peptidoglycan-binding domain-containing protein [Deltaproteobacteria bacterium]|nr:LysM peptidoglycan-binding domain-containing protein [Deltaproteobacteria bacterium]